MGSERLGYITKQVELLSPTPSCPLRSSIHALTSLHVSSTDWSRLPETIRPVSLLTGLPLCLSEIALYISHLLRPFARGFTEETLASYARILQEFLEYQAAAAAAAERITTMGGDDGAQLEAEVDDGRWDGRTWRCGDCVMLVFRKHFQTWIKEEKMEMVRRIEMSANHQIFGRN